MTAADAPAARPTVLVAQESDPEPRPRKVTAAGARKRPAPARPGPNAAGETARVRDMPVDRTAIRGAPPVAAPPVVAPPVASAAPAPGVKPSVVMGSLASSPFEIRKPHTFLRGHLILSMLLLFEGAALPRLGGDMHLLPPWALAREIGGLTFHHALFFGVLLVVAAIPLPYLLRAAAAAGAGAVMMVFGLQHLDFEVTDFAFRGHPGMVLLVTHRATLALVAASLLFPAALYWRARYTASFWSRITVLLGVLVLLGAYLFAGPSGGEPPIVALVRIAAHSDALIASRICAALLLVPPALVPLSAFVLLRHPHTGGAGLWAWLFVTALGAVPLVQAGFVAHFRDGGWKYALAPLKVGLFLYAGILVATIGAGHVLGEVERLIVVWRLRRRRRAAGTV